MQLESERGVTVGKRKNRKSSQKWIQRTPDNSIAQFVRTVFVIENDNKTKNVKKIRHKCQNTTNRQRTGLCEGWEFCVPVARLAVTFVYLRPNYKRSLELLLLNGLAPAQLAQSIYVKAVI